MSSRRKKDRQVGEGTGGVYRYIESCGEISSPVMYEPCLGRRGWLFGYPRLCAIPAASLFSTSVCVTLPLALRHKTSVRLLEDFSQVCITQHELVGTCAAGGRTSSKAVGTRQRSKVTNCLAELETCQQLSTFLVCYRRTPLRLHRRMPSMCEGRYTNDASDARAAPSF